MKRNKGDWLLTCLRDVEYNITLRKDAYEEEFETYNSIFEKKNKEAEVFLEEVKNFKKKAIKFLDNY